MSVHVIVGEDEFLVSAAAKKAVGDGVGLEVVDSANSANAEQQLADIRAADDSVSTPPFLEPRKTTWWRNVHFLPGGRVAEEVKVALERFAARIAAAPPPENQGFVISGPRLLKTSLFAIRMSGLYSIKRILASLQATTPGYQLRPATTWFFSTTIPR